MNSNLVKVILVFFMFYKPVFALECIATYEVDVTKNLSIQEMAYIQVITESPGLSRFEYAQTIDKLDVTKLTQEDRAYLINLLVAQGVTVNRKAFLKDGGYSECMKTYILKYENALGNLLQKANIEANSLGNLEVKDWLEMGWVTFSDGVSLGSDLFGVGEAVKASKAMLVVSKKTPLLLKAIKKVDPSKAKTMKKFFDFFSSKRWIAVSELINSNFSVRSLQSDSKEEVQSVLIEGLGNTAGKIISETLSSSQKGYLIKLFVSKFFESTSLLMTKSTSGIIKNNEVKKIIKDILNSLVDLVPVVGPLHHAYVLMGEIAGRTTVSDKALLAWDTYTLRRNLFLAELTTIRERDMKARLSKLVDSSNRINIQVFRDVPVNHWAFVPIHSLKKLNIISGDKYGNYNPEDKVSIGEFFKFITRSMFNKENYGSDTSIPFKKYFSFLLEKGIDLSDPSGKQVSFTTNFSKALISRGYVAKVTSNIINFRNSHIKNDCINIIDDGVINATCVSGYDPTSNDNGHYPQIKKCSSLGAGWDSCSDILRKYRIVDGKNSSGYSAMDPLLRSELSKIIFKSLIHVKGMSSSPTLRDLEIGF